CQCEDFIRNSIEGHPALVLVPELRPVFGKLCTSIDIAEGREFLGQPAILLKVMPYLSLLDLLHVCPECPAAVIERRMKLHAEQDPEAKRAECFEHSKPQVAGRDRARYFQSSSP